MKVYVASVRLGTYTRMLGVFLSPEDAKEWIAKNVFQLQVEDSKFGNTLKVDQLRGEIKVILDGYVRKGKWAKAFDLVNSQRQAPVVISAVPMPARSVLDLARECRENLLGCKVPGRVITRLEEIERLCGGE